MTLNCGCTDHNDDEYVGCESCGYKSCLDCHHIDSTPANVDDWKCKEGYGCGRRMTGYEYVIYPVYHREGYGFQQDNPEGTDGKAVYYVLYEEDIEHGGEGHEVVSFGVTEIKEMQQVADYLNNREG